jgi:hypothetical protein
MGNFGTKYAVSINNRDYSGTGVEGLLSSVIEEDGVDYISNFNKFEAFEKVTAMYKDDMIKNANEMMKKWKSSNVPENQIARNLVVFFQELIQKLVTSVMKKYVNAPSVRFGSRRRKQRKSSFGKKSKTKKRRSSSFGRKGKKGMKKVRA